MNRIVFAISILASSAIVGAQPIPSPINQTQIAELIEALYKQPWPGAENRGNPTYWEFNFTDPMKQLLDIGPAAQEPLLTKVFDLEIADQIIILLGGVGDERSVGPIIEAMTSASAESSTIRRKRTLTAGNLALTNITVADVIWHHGGGITVDACPNDPAGCWSSWWERNKAGFRVRDIAQSRRYVNYPNYGVYRGLP